MGFGERIAQAHHAISVMSRFNASTAGRKVLAAIAPYNQQRARPYSWSKIVDAYLVTFKGSPSHFMQTMAGAPTSFAKPIAPGYQSTEKHTSRQ